MSSALTFGLIDDAGLYPPACKSFEAAVADHVAARAGTRSNALGRFVCSVSRLGELAGRSAEVPRIVAVANAATDSWGIELERNVATVLASERGRDVEALEFPLPAGGLSLTEVDRLAALAHDLEHEGLALVAEVCSWDPAAITDTIQSLGGSRVAVKFRCGSEQPGGVPPVHALAAFVSEARRSGLAFKLTAGLHHAVRAADGSHHGFVNVLAACAFALESVPAALAETSPAALAVSEDSLHWRNQTADEVALARARSMFLCFGSCSFDEPLDSLEELRGRRPTLV